VTAPTYKAPALRRARFAELPPSSLLRLAAQLVELMAPTIEQDAALIVAFRSAAGLLEVATAKYDRPTEDAAYAGRLSLLREIGQVRS
jgi:hypothetical protein